MKYRNDFVSNSSSCSFIVYDPQKAFELLVTDFDDQLFNDSYSFQELGARLTVDSKYADEFNSVLEKYGENPYQSESWEDKNNIEFLNIYFISVYKIFKFHRELFNHIISFEIVSESDYEDRHVLEMLNMLYLYFEKYNVNIDDCDSNIDIDKRIDHLYAELIKKFYQ